MSASRNSSFKALKHLSAHSRQHVRHLHMTEPKTYASRLLSSQHGAAMPGMSSERRLSEGPANHQINDPLNSTRGMTTVAPSVTANTRPSVTTSSGPAKPSRHFNTSRSLKSVGDTSTIDFAFLPMDGAVTSMTEPALRVPILPHVSPVRTGALAQEAPDFDKVHRVEINLLSAESTHVAAPSAMSEVHDNESVNHDFHEIAEALKVKPQRVVRDMSTMRQLWDGLVEDVMGASKGKIAFA